MTARYTIFQSRAVTDPNLTDRELRVLALLGTYSDKAGWCYPHQKTLAGRLDTSRQLVNRSIKKLVTLRYLEKRYKYRDDGGLSGCEYRIMMDEPDDEAGGGTGEVTPPEPNAAHGVSPPDVTSPVTSEDDSNNDPTERPQKNDKVDPDFQLEGEGGDHRPPEKQVFDRYNELCAETTWPVAKVFTGQRRKAIHARLAESSLQEVLAALDRAARSDFLSGRASQSDAHKNWRCDLDFLMKPAKFAFLIEGKYDNKGDTGSRASPDDVWTARVRSVLDAMEGGRKWVWLDSWGPNPFQEGCLAPPAVLEAFADRIAALKRRHAA